MLFGVFPVPKKMKPIKSHLLTAAFGVTAWLPICQAQTECFTADDITGSVLGTFFSTLAAFAIGFLIYWFVCRKRPEKPAILRPRDEDIEKHAYSNPFFQDDEPDKAVAPKSTENGKNDIGGTKVTLGSDKVPNNAPAKGNKKTKTTRSNPFSVFTNSKVQHPQRALDDSCIHQEPERIEICLRGSDFTGLGFNICGNIRDGIYVRDVLNRGPAGESGKIKAGDRIYNVTVSFEKITIEDALTILSYASPYDVILDVQKTSEHGNSFMPGHQKKGSMDSSTSGSMGGGGERLTHPIYRSQSSDDVSHIGSREISNNSKRSLSVGVVPVRMKKDASNNANVPNLQRQTIKEDNSQPSSNVESSRHSSHAEEKTGVLSTSNNEEVQIMIHNEEKSNDNLLSNPQKKLAHHKTEELLVKRDVYDVEELNDEVDNKTDDTVNIFGNPFKGSHFVTDTKYKPQITKDGHDATTSDEFTHYVSDIPSTVNANHNESTPSVKVSFQTADTTNLDIDNIQLHFPDNLNNYSTNAQKNLNEKQFFNLESNSSSVNPFEVSVASHKIKQTNLNLKTPKSFVEPTDDISKAISENALNPLQQSSSKELVEINSKEIDYPSVSLTDSLNDSLTDFDIFIPNLGLDDLQETLQATMIGENVDEKNFFTDKGNKSANLLPEKIQKNTTDVSGVSGKRRNQGEDMKRNGKIFTEDEINSHWQAIEGNIPLDAADNTVSLELSEESSNVESLIDSLETPPKNLPQISDLKNDKSGNFFPKPFPQNVIIPSVVKMNGQSHIVTTDDDGEITSEFLENASVPSKTSGSSKELHDRKKTTEESTVSTKRRAPTVQLPRVDIKIPNNIDFDSTTANNLNLKEEHPAKDKSSLNAEILVDSDLNENIEYFESKMQSVLQKSPKIKSKRSSVPGKRKAPPPPNHQINLSQQTDNKSSSKNPFVIGLTPMAEDNPTYKSESVVFIQPNNVTTVQVNAPSEDQCSGDKQTFNPETGKTSKKSSNKLDGKLGFGYLKTNFFEGLDKAGEDDLMSKEANRFHSIPRSGLPYERNGKYVAIRRSSSLEDLSKIEETISKSSPLERAVSMDLKSADDVLSEKFGELKMHDDLTGETSTPIEYNDEKGLSKPEINQNYAEENARKTHENPNASSVNNESVPSHKTSSEKINSQDATHPEKVKIQFNIVEGFLKTDEDCKKGATNLIQVVPVSPRLISKTVDNENRDDMNMHADNDQTKMADDNDFMPHYDSAKFTKRQQSLSSSSLSEDSIDGERYDDSLPTKRMLAVDPSLKENYIYDSDSDEDDSTFKKVFHVTNEVNNLTQSSDAKRNNDFHGDAWFGMAKESSSVTIPIIPPIITSKEIRSPTNSREDFEEQFHQPKPHDGVKEDGAQNRGPVKSLSPTKFPRPWHSSSAVEEQPFEENGNSERDHELTSYHYTFNYNPSTSGNHIPSDENLSVTTMHVTVSNNNSSTKNSVISGESYKTFPVLPQTNISKTVIFSNSELSLPVDISHDNSGLESPPPILQPPE